MVRLKDKLRPILIDETVISIPYGSIKRIELNKFLITLCFISIPYGSIKSSVGQLADKSRRISIPYGSIKSELVPQYQPRDRNFNSLWFD